jgi:hypothetical protein
LGAVQGDSIRNITGEFIGADDNSRVYPVKHAFYLGAWGGIFDGTGGAGKEHPIIFDASRVVPTATENRPVNTAVRYLIRALP